MSHPILNLKNTSIGRWRWEFPIIGTLEYPGEPFLHKKSNGLGLAIGMTLWGCILYLFAALTGLSGAAFWIFAIASLVLLLVGSMGACMELFGEEK